MDGARLCLLRQLCKRSSIEVQLDKLGGQLCGVPRRKVPRIPSAQQPHVPIDVRGQHGRATAHGLDHDVGAPLHSAGMHEDMGALNSPSGRIVRQRSQPSVIGASCLKDLRLLPQVGVQCCTDVVKVDVGIVSQ